MTSPANTQLNEQYRKGSVWETSAATAITPRLVAWESWVGCKSRPITCQPSFKSDAVNSPLPDPRSKSFPGLSVEIIRRAFRSLDSRSSTLWWANVLSLYREAD